MFLLFAIPFVFCNAICFFFYTVRVLLYRSCLVIVFAFCNIILVLQYGSWFAIPFVLCNTICVLQHHSCFAVPLLLQHCVRVLQYHSSSATPFAFCNTIRILQYRSYVAIPSDCSSDRAYYVIMFFFVKVTFCMTYSIHRALSIQLLRAGATKQCRCALTVYNTRY